MKKEQYIKPVVMKQTLEAEVLCSNHGSPNGGQPGGGGVVAGWQWKKNWH